MIADLAKKLKKNKFLFEELVKRDFKQKYKGTSLGMLWSLLSPLFMLLVMALVFTQFFGRDTPHYIVYVFAGNLVFTYFRDATTGGMSALTSNASIFTKVNVPKYLFLLSKSVSSLFNFLLTLIIFFLFVAGDGIAFHWNFLLLIYPTLCLVAFNLGVGLILSAMYVVFKDTKYLYDVFLRALMYLSAVFYNIELYSKNLQYLFYLNPVYVYIRYFRKIVIDNTIPQFSFHLLCAFYAITALLIGGILYKKFNHKFLYYV